jgi:4-hydroxybenzoate polyprenyltransferase
MRPRQWSKNALIFAAIVFDRQLHRAEPLLRVTVGFILLCLVASTIYLVNDIVDIERDKLHPKKKFRPIPSGQLPIPMAIAAAVVLPIVAIGIAFAYSVPLAIVLLAYLTLHIAYSFYLKNIVLIDVFTIAAGFVLRVVAGVVVIKVTQFSPWLYACASFLSLFLAVGKRRQEMLLLAGNAADVRSTYKHYNLAGRYAADGDDGQRACLYAVYLRSADQPGLDGDAADGAVRGLRGLPLYVPDPCSG